MKIEALQSQKDSIEIQAQKKQQIEYELQGSIMPKPNHKIFELNIETGEVKEAEYKIECFVIGANNKARLIVNKDCIYIPALNIKNAKKHYLKDNKQSSYYTKEARLSFL